MIGLEVTRTYVYSFSERKQCIRRSAAGHLPIRAGPRRDILPRGESDDMPSHGAAGSLFLKLFYW